MTRAKNHFYILKCNFCGQKSQVEKSKIALRDYNLFLKYARFLELKEMLHH